ncbi:MAG TPA: ADP-ribosylglycohydrolase family protein [Anaerolineaceae bacterium]|nr:ADP-ribosylglycohydrolase family protein [Anaerolineaceae bacterium]
MFPPAKISKSRLYGCAIGAALGDAFGMPLEFFPARPADNLLRTLTAGRLPTGTITDDTEMALALAESLAALKPLDPADLVQRFVDWFHSNPPDVGIHTATVLRGVVVHGLPWEQAVERAQAAKPQNAGNGSLMRCWPVALSYWDQRELLIEQSALQSRVTHPHEECVAACVFANVIIAELVAGAAPLEAYHAALEQVPLPAGLESAVRAAPTRHREELLNTGWVRHTLEAAIWALLTTQSYAEAVIQAANLGNDADTSAAVTGALAGAAYGLEGIPAAWRTKLRGEWPPLAPKEWNEANFMALVDQIIPLPDIA